MFENFNMHESREKKSLKNKRPYFMAALIAFGAYAEASNNADADTSDQAEKVHIAEMGPSMTWKDGVAKMREDVFHSSKETGSLYVLFKDGTGRWIDPVVTEEGTTAIERVPESEREKIDKEVDWVDVEKVCSFHTHTLSAIADGSVGWITQDEMMSYRAQENDRDAIFPSVPPSLDDTDYWNSVVGEDVYKDTPLYSGVQDANGIWYYRMAMNEDVDLFPERKSAVAQLQEAADSFEMAYEVRSETITQEELDSLFELVSDRAKRSHKKYLQEASRSSGDILRDKKMRLYMDLTVGNEALAKQYFSQEDLDNYNVYLRGIRSLDTAAMERDFMEKKRQFGQETRNIPMSEEQYRAIQMGYMDVGIVANFVSYEDALEQSPCGGAW